MHMVDVKVSVKDEKELVFLNQAVKIYSDDIGMEFR